MNSICDTIVIVIVNVFVYIIGLLLTYYIYINK